MKAIIVGGGIGGAVTALALRREGVDVALYEQAAQFDEVGAGLQLSANAVRVLDYLGVGDAVRSVGVAAESVEFRDLSTDDLLHWTPLGVSEQDRLGAEFIQAQRPDLLEILVRRLPSDVFHLGRRLTNFDQDSSGVTAHFDSGESARGDVLIGADGIHSTVREHLFGADDPEFSKIIAWRALIPWGRLRGLDIEPKCHVWLAPHRSVVLYWVRHQNLLNFVGIVPSQEAAAESWTKRGEVQAIRDSYAGATGRVGEVISHIEDPFVTGYYFRRPLTQWSLGRVTILGDAAHPMHPFLAQGACQAIEDAAVLSRLLASEDTDPAGRLREYQDKRLPRASRVQQSSMDQERVWHMSDPGQIAVRNKQLTSMMQIDPRSRGLFGWIHEHDPYRLAHRSYAAPWTSMQRDESQRAWTLWDGFASPDDVARGYHGLRQAYGRFLQQTFPVPPQAHIETPQADGVELRRVCAPEASSNTARVLHVHGGAYVCGSAHESGEFSYRLSQATGCVVDAVEYRLAPEHPFPAAVDDCVQAYRWLLESEQLTPDQVVITGESAGGALAIAAALRAQSSSLPAPAGIVAICPMADLTLTSSTIDTCADTEPICTREFLTNMASLYLQGHEPTDPYASPVFADLQALPPLLVQAADNEALFGDADRLAHAAHDVGVRAELDTYSDSVHVFPLFNFLPEATAALERIAGFVGEVTRAMTTDTTI